MWHLTQRKLWNTTATVFLFMSPMNDGQLSSKIPLDVNERGKMKPFDSTKTHHTKHMWLNILKLNVGYTEALSSGKDPPGLLRNKRSTVGIHRGQQKAWKELVWEIIRSKKIQQEKVFHTQEQKAEQKRIYPHNLYNWLQIYLNKQHGDPYRDDSKEPQALVFTCFRNY